jgi:hypothetical protein
VSDQSSSSVVTLPPGVVISPGRETVQSGPTGASIPGMLFTLTLPNNAQTSVFVPYSQMSDLAAVSALFATRVAAIQGVAALGSS